MARDIIKELEGVLRNEKITHVARPRAERAVRRMKRDRATIRRLYAECDRLAGHVLLLKLSQVERENEALRIIGPGG